MEGSSVNDLDGKDRHTSSRMGLGLKELAVDVLHRRIPLDKEYSTTRRGSGISRANDDRGSDLIS